MNAHQSVDETESSRYGIVDANITAWKYYTVGPNLKYEECRYNRVDTNGSSWVENTQHTTFGFNTKLILHRGPFLVTGSLRFPLSGNKDRTIDRTLNDLSIDIAQQYLRENTNFIAGNSVEIAIHCGYVF